MHQVIARCGVSQFSNEVVHSEQKLCLGRECGVGLQAHISCARSVGSDGLSAGLRVCAKLRAKRSFKFELAQQRFDIALELRVVCDGICEVRAPNFLSLLRAERDYKKIPPVVHRARANAQIKLKVGNKSSDLVAGQLAKARFSRQFE